MFDVGWSELLIIGVVALLVVGPKELPVLLRTIGQYVGMIRRQASEFRAQFDEAIRDSEIQDLRKEVESIKTDAENSIRSAEESFEKSMSDDLKDDAGHHFDPVQTSDASNGAAGKNGAVADAHGAGAEVPKDGAGSAAIAAAAAAAAVGKGHVPGHVPVRAMEQGVADKVGASDKKDV